MTDTPKPAPTVADLIEQAHDAAESLETSLASMRRDFRDIYRMLGVPLPESLREKE